MKLSLRIHLPFSNSLLFLCILILSIPVLSPGKDFGYYAVYRASEQRCLLIANISHMKSGDHVYGGPYSIQEGLEILRKSCPIPLQEAGDWFAVKRKEDCWLIEGVAGLNPGDTILEGNLSRVMAEILLYEECGSFQVLEAGETFSPPSPPPEKEKPPPLLPPAPAMEWQKTEVDWVDVYATGDGTVTAKIVSGTDLPESPVQPLSPFVSIQPVDEVSAPGAVRVRMPENVVIPPEDRGRVALAFYEESYSLTKDKTYQTWHLHAADYDPSTGTFEATLNHNSFIVWGLITLAGGVTILVWDDATRMMLSKKENDHFVLHYKKGLIPDDTVTYTLAQLEKARSFLIGSYSLRYPPSPAKLDVYYVGIKSDEVTYGLFQEGKGGGKWIDLNIPSSIANYSRNELTATIVHELFHFIQPLYEGEKSFWTRVTGGEVPYGWINEALSSATEHAYVTAPTFVPDQNSPILNKEVYSIGLQNVVKAKDGYSAGVFFDFLRRRYGNELFYEILQECLRQVQNKTKFSAYLALRRAIERRGRQMQSESVDYSSLTEAWKAFVVAFLVDGSKEIDPRLNRKLPFTISNPGMVSVTTDGIMQTWSVDAPSMSFPPRQARSFKIQPAERNKEAEATVDCTVSFTKENGSTLPFYAPVFSFEKQGSHGYISADSTFHGALSDTTASVTATLSFKKETRFRILTVVPVGLGDEPSLADARAKGTMEVNCKLRKETEVPEYETSAVSTGAIESYYRTLVQSFPVWVQRKSTQYCHFVEVCTGCEDQFKAAAAEYAPKRDAMYELMKQVDRIEEDAQPLQRIVSTYSRNRFTEGNTIQAADRPKLSRIMDANEHFHPLNTYCMFSPGEYMSAMGPLFIKGEFPASPYKLESLGKHCRPPKCPMPKAEKLTSEIKWMQDQFANISPCRKAIKDVNAFWNSEKGELLRIIEELKAKYQWLQ